MLATLLKTKLYTIFHHYLPAGVETFLMISERRTSGWDKTPMIMLGMYMYVDMLIITVLSDR